MDVIDKLNKPVLRIFKSLKPRFFKPMSVSSLLLEIVSIESIGYFDIKDKTYLFINFRQCSSSFAN